MIEKLKRKNLNILFVEDDASIREPFSKVLETLFGKIFIANNGSDGLNLFNAHKNEINAVISDINMPILNGIDMMTSIHKEKDENLITIFISGYGDKEELHKALKLSADLYESKPVKINKIIKRIVRLYDSLELNTKIKEKSFEIESMLTVFNEISISISINNKLNIIEQDERLSNFLGLKEEDNIISISELLSNKDIIDIENHFKENETIFKLKTSISFNDIKKHVNIFFLPVSNHINKEIRVIIFDETEDTISRLEKNRHKMKLLNNEKIKSSKKDKEIENLVKKIDSDKDKINNFNIVYEQFLLSRKKNKQLILQIAHYEDLIKNRSENERIQAVKANESLKKMMQKSQQNSAEKIRELNKKNTALIKQTMEQDENLKTIKEQEKRIEDLKSLVADLESEIIKLERKLKYK